MESAVAFHIQRSEFPAAKEKLTMKRIGKK